MYAPGTRIHVKVRLYKYLNTSQVQASKVANHDDTRFRLPKPEFRGATETTMTRSGRPATLEKTMNSLGGVAVR